MLLGKDLRSPARLLTSLVSFGRNKSCLTGTSLHLRDSYIDYDSPKYLRNQLKFIDKFERIGLRESRLILCFILMLL